MPPKIEGFDIIEPLPRGGLWLAYKAMQRALDRFVVLKFLPDDVALDISDEGLFMRCAKSAASLKHPNIAQVYDVMRIEDKICFVLEFISGCSIEEWLQKSKALSRRNTLLVLENVAIALDYAWQDGNLFHGGIKPSNIMIDADGTVKVTDFGISPAFLLDPAQTEPSFFFRAVVPNYLSPEQCANAGDIDCRSDIYSLGAVLYKMIAGVTPFGDFAPTDVLKQHLEGRLNNPRSINPNVPRELAGLTEKMLIRDRSQRHQSWGQVLKDIGKVKAGLTPSIAVSAADASIVLGHVEEPPGASAGAVLVEDATQPDAPAQSRLRQAVKYVLNKAAGLSSQQKMAVAAGVALAVLLLIAGVVSAIRRPPPPAPPPETVRDLPVQPAPATPEQPDRPARTHTAAEKESASRSAFDEAMRWIRANPAEPAEGIRKLQAVVNSAAGTAAAIDAGNEIARLNEVKTLQETLQWTRTNPGQPEEGLRRLRALVNSASIRDVATAAAAEIERLTAVKNSESTKVIEELQRRAEEFASKNRFQEAINVFENYNGPFGPETLALRAEKAAGIRDRESAWNERRREEQALAAAKLSSIFASAADSVLKKNPPAAIQIMNDAVEEQSLAAWRGDFEHASSILKDVDNVETAVMRSFSDDLGKEIKIELVSGQDTLVIRRVAGNALEAEKIIQISAGEMRRPQIVRYEHLTAAEKRRRLGPAESPTGAIMHGLFSYEQGDYPKAKEHFAQADPPLSEALVAAVDRNVAGGLDKKAESDLALILRTLRVSVPDGDFDLETWREAAQKRQFNEQEREALRRAMQNYTQKHGQTDFVARAKPLLNELSGGGQAQPQRQPPSPPPAQPQHRPYSPTPDSTPQPSRPLSPDYDPLFDD